MTPPLFVPAIWINTGEAILSEQYWCFNLSKFSKPFGTSINLDTQPSEATPQKLTIARSCPLLSCSFQNLSISLLIIFHSYSTPMQMQGFLAQAQAVSLKARLLPLTLPKEFKLEK
jgi:hypothetical protein